MILLALGYLAYALASLLSYIRMQAARKSSRTSRARASKLRNVHHPLLSSGRADNPADGRRSRSRPQPPADAWAGGSGGRGRTAAYLLGRRISEDAEVWQAMQGAGGVANGFDPWVRWRRCCWRVISCSTSEPSSWYNPDLQMPSAQQQEQLRKVVENVHENPGTIFFSDDPGVLALAGKITPYDYPFTMAALATQNRWD